MNKYESTKIQDILEAPLLYDNNFKQLFDEFELLGKSNIIDKINNNNHKINNIFIENNNNFPNEGIFISFGKKINNQEFSPIPVPSSDSQKNKLSIIQDKIQDNSLSPLPINDRNFPIIKDINNYDTNKNNIEKIVNNDNSSNMNNINTSLDMKNSIEQSTKIVTRADIKPLLNNSLDSIDIDNSNMYNLDKENNAEKEYIYEPTNIQGILNLNFDIIFDNNKFNSVFQQLENLDKITNENKNEMSPGKNMEMYKDNNDNMYTIKEEEEEDLYDPESRNLSMKNSSLKNILVLSKNQENIESLNNKEKKKQNSKEINKFNHINNQKKLEIPDFEEYFRPEPNKLNPIELKINNKNEEYINNEKSEQLFDKILTKGNINNDEKNDKNIFNNQANSSNYNNNYNFSFGKIIPNNDNNNDDKNNESSNQKNINNINNRGVNGDEIFTFDKKKNIIGSEKDDFKENKNINNGEITQINLEKEKLINNSDNSNNKNKIDNPFYNPKLAHSIQNEIEDFTQQNPNSNEKNIECLYDNPSSKKEEEQENIKEIEENNNEINNDNAIKNNENQKYENNNKNIDDNEENNLNNIKNIENINNNNNKKDNNHTFQINEEIGGNNANNNKKEEIIIDDNNTKEKESNNLNNDEQIILNISDSIEGNKHKKIEFNKYIQSPEINSSISSQKKRFDNNIKFSLSNMKPKIISKMHIRNLKKLYPNFNLQINENNINKAFLNYFLKDYNQIIFKNNMNNDDNNTIQISLKSYFNILNKLREKEIITFDECVKKLINSTSIQIENIKKEKNINNSQLLLKKNNNDSWPEIKNNTMNMLFSEFKKKIKEINNYHNDPSHKTNNANNIRKLIDKLEDIYCDIIKYGNTIYKNSEIEKIFLYQKIINELEMSNNKTNSQINKNIDIVNNEPKNKSFINNLYLLIGGLLLLVLIIISFK